MCSDPGNNNDYNGCSWGSSYCVPGTVLSQWHGFTHWLYEGNGWGFISARCAIGVSCLSCGEEWPQCSPVTSHKQHRVNWIRRWPLVPFLWPWISEVIGVKLVLFCLNLWNGDDDDTYLMGLLWFYELIHTQKSAEASGSQLRQVCPPGDLWWQLQTFWSSPGVGVKGRCHWHRVYRDLRWYQCTG